MNTYFVAPNLADLCDKVFYTHTRARHAQGEESFWSQGLQEYGEFLNESLGQSIAM